MFYITGPEQRPAGYVVLSESREWVIWLNRNIPRSIDQDVRGRLTSNLKHLIVGLELKAALIHGHRRRQPGDRGTLFEPYYQNFILEFCVATFSVLEGLGSAHWLDQSERDGADGARIQREQWKMALCAVYDPDARRGLDDSVEQVLAVRDKLHQDRLGTRADIDWHAFSYEGAYTPAGLAIQTLLLRHADQVPGTTNLINVPD